MIRIDVVLLVALVSCGGASPRVQGAVDDDERRDAESRIADATAIMGGSHRTPDAGLPHAIAQSARCIIIIPSMVQLALVLGTRRGRGVASCRSAEGWSAPVFVRASGAGAGLAIGVASVDLVLVVVSDETARSLLHTRVELGIDSAVVAGPVGRSAQAGTTPALGQGAYSYSSASGVFAGVSVTSLVIEHDEEAQRAYYGDARSFAVLLRGTSAPPPSAASFISSMDATLAR